MKETGGQLNCYERILDPQTVLAHVRASKSPKIGTQIILSEKIYLEVIAREESLFKLAFHRG